jgi:hypothetical protein
MSDFNSTGFIGNQDFATSARAPFFRQGNQGDLLVGQLHGTRYEQAVRGKLYSISCMPATTAAPTALSAATILLTASAQPIVGVWNPTNSGKNLVILEAMLVDVINNVTSVAPGSFVWAGSTGNTATMTAGLTPYSRKNFGAATDTASKGFALSTASLLTGLVNNLVIFEAAEFNVASGLLTTTVAASTPTPSVAGVQYFDGSLIVPPGGVLALLNTVSSVTHSVTARLLWEEVPTV